MFKLIMFAIPFLKELFFDRKEEADFTSPHFHTRKWIRFVGFSISMFLAIFATKRLISLSSEHLKLREDYTELRQAIEKKDQAITDLQEQSTDLRKELSDVEKSCRRRR